MAPRLPGLWSDLTSPDFKTLDPERTVAVLPLGAIEQHGPHLPVNVDACIAEGMVTRAVQKAPEGLPILQLPVTAVGKSNEHLAFPGTLTLSAETLTRLWFEIGESVHRAGVGKLIMVNAHGGQPQVMEIVARELRVELGMMAVSCSWFALGLPPGLFSEDEMAKGIHGGALETSVMLALRPDLVDMSQAKDFHPTIPQVAKAYDKLRYIGGVGMGWQAQDLHPEGACGDASVATAEHGEQVIDHVTTEMVKLFEDVVRFPLSGIVPLSGIAKA